MDRAHEQAASILREARDLLAPVDHLRSTLVRHVVAASHVGVEHGRQEIGPRLRRACQLPMNHDRNGMRVAHCIGHHKLLNSP